MRGNTVLAIAVILLFLGGWYFYSSPETPPYKENAVPTSADNAPPGPIHNLPVPEAVAVVRAKVAQEEKVDEGVVIVMSAYEKDWPNACLGLELQEEMCAQVITPGFEVVVQVSTTGERFTYRTNYNGSIVRSE
ncbi:hypothetical protein CL652_02330 [bacterium]|nr:hypothetical protein [bacterium]|tara:strand:+ start:11585 stop:11986 length:402 start_codon:yes stop_codon:yes gene_type:complete